MSKKPTQAPRYGEVHRARGDDSPISFFVYSLRGKGAATIADSTHDFLLTVNEVENPGDPNSTELVQLTGIIVDVDLAEVAFPISASEVDILEPGDYWHDIQMEDENGKKWTLQKGPFTVTQDITK